MDFVALIVGYACIGMVSFLVFSFVCWLLVALVIGLCLRGETINTGDCALKALLKVIFSAHRVMNQAELKAAKKETPNGHG